jgi:hypothetical protein
MYLDVFSCLYLDKTVSLVLGWREYSFILLANVAGHDLVTFTVYLHVFMCCYMLTYSSTLA